MRAHRLRIWRNHGDNCTITMWLSKFCPFATISRYDACLEGPVAQGFLKHVDAEPTAGRRWICGLPRKKNVRICSTLSCLQLHFVAQWLRACHRRWPSVCTGVTISSVGSSDNSRLHHLLSAACVSSAPHSYAAVVSSGHFCQVDVAIVQVAAFIQMCPRMFLKFRILSCNSMLFIV